jgi:DNA mismatch repair protein MutS
MPSKLRKVSPAFEVYLKAQEKAEQLHGTNTIVMMQMGSFLEMFHVKFKDGSELGKANEIDDLLSKMGEKQEQVGKMFNGKEIASVSRYGFPFLAESKERYISIVNSRGYTVPVYYQKGNEKDPMTKIVPRFLGDTWTPTIRPNVSTSTNTNEWFVGYLLDEYGSDRLRVSICAINPYTRSFKTSEFPTIKGSAKYIPESSDFLRMNHPTEVIIWARKEVSIPDLGVPETIPVRRLPLIHLGTDVKTRECVMNLLAHEYVIPRDIPEVVVRSFDFMMSTIPDIMCDTKYHLVKVEQAKTMILENHCLSQLNMIDTHYGSNVRRKNRSVLGTINHTITPMGDRTLREWVTHPSTSKSVIEYRMGLGKHMVHGNRANEWEHTLRGMADLGRLFSSEVLGGLSYTLLMKCVNTIEHFIEHDAKDPLEYNGTRFPMPVSEARELLNEIEQTLVKPETLVYNGTMVGSGALNAYNSPCEIEFPFTSKIEIEGKDDLLQTYQEYTQFMNYLKEFGKSLDLEIGYVNTTYVLWVRGGKKGSVTPNGKVWKNARKVESKNAKGRYELDGETTIQYQNTNMRVCEYLSRLNRVRSKLETQVQKAWFVWSKCAREKYGELVTRIAILIGDVDSALSGVKCVQMYGYSYANVNSGESYYKVDGLRHPLIETIQQDTPYVPHTISITPTKRGRLLFGVNSSGKSSLMKAIGISILLAQAGLPVPARSLDLGIYTSVFTRILGNDNLFQGMSTFMVEASELLRILKTSTEHSMVLGDELCSGTEQYGAEAIVASSILTLLKRNVSFVFATHWHRLRDLPELKSHPKLLWNHLRVDCDDSGRMIMHRTLEDGPGPRGYAIEYMRNMGADMEMIEEAMRIRKRITSEEFALQSVRSWNGKNDTTEWNSRAKIDSLCQVCKERRSEETDHIIPREYSNENGGLQGRGSVHHGGNLVGLCKVCHDKKTRGIIHIHGFREILRENGIRERVLEWEYVKNERTQGKEVEDEKENVIKELIVRFSCSGSSIRQIQSAMKRNGFSVKQSFIRDTLSENL